MSIGRFGTYMTHVLETGFEIMKKKIQTVALRSEDTILSQEGFVIRAMVGHSQVKIQPGWKILWENSPSPPRKMCMMPFGRLERRFRLGLPRLLPPGAKLSETWADY